VNNRLHPSCLHAKAPFPPPILIVAVGLSVCVGMCVCLLQLALEKSEAATAKVRMESALMSAASHPHILRHVEYLEHEGRAVLVTELCSLGSLESVLQALRASGSRRGLDEGVVALVLMHICLALSLLHANEIIHRDIKVRERERRRDERSTTLLVVCAFRERVV
jgi:serine/threonine protein kinase